MKAKRTKKAQQAEEPVKLHVENFGGNLFEAADSINKYCPDIVPRIVTMSCSSPYNYTIVVYRGPESPFFIEGRRRRQEAYDAAQKRGPLEFK